MIKNHGLKHVVAGLGLGFVFGALSFGLEHLTSAGAFVFLFLPGIIVSMAVSNNVHALPLGFVACGNFLFWFLAGWLVTSLIDRIGRKPKADDQT